MDLAVVREADVDLQLCRVPLGPSRRPIGTIASCGLLVSSRHRGRPGATAPVGADTALGSPVRSTPTRTTRREQASGRPRHPGPDRGTRAPCGQLAKNIRASCKIRGSGSEFVIGWYARLPLENRTNMPALLGALVRRAPGASRWSAPWTNDLDLRAPRYHARRIKVGLVVSAVAGSQAYLGAAALTRRHDGWSGFSQRVRPHILGRGGWPGAAHKRCRELLQAGRQAAIEAAMLSLGQALRDHPSQLGGSSRLIGFAKAPIER